MIPRTTYRLQFHRDFGFDDAAQIIPYLAQLGVSHLYASPWLKARPGSTHGYDIVDHNSLNPELGGAEAFGRMRTSLEAHGLKQILDFVPNHMGVGGSDNPLWLDVLEWGRHSAYAGWFDIDWKPERPYIHNKLLVPFLQDQYGVALAKGDLVLKWDADAGSFAVWAYDAHKLPICPLSYDRILGIEHVVLERIGDAFANLAAWHPHTVRRASDLKAELAAVARASTDVRDAVEAAVARLNATQGDLNALVQDQHWRVAHFRVASDDINYRRFFNINDLAALRMEVPEVFEYTHRFVSELLQNGELDGLRIDHLDGLLDPKEYLSRLRSVSERSFYLVVEKVLAHHEAMPTDWPVDGTTGYEFANLVLGLLIDRKAESEFTRIYRDFTGDTSTFQEIARSSKTRIMENEMASELHVLAQEAARIAQQNPNTSDFTYNILRRALQEVVASFPVYRTYLDTEGELSELDRRSLEWACTQARAHAPEVDASAFDFISQLLSGDLVSRPRSGFSRHAVLRFAMKVQRYSGPVMAKGLEDTAFYRYNRFIALNEVGGQPDRFGGSIAAFHKANSYRAKHWPHTMLSTSTHDTKRGEDVRARLAVLSEMPDEWARQVDAWSRILRARRGDTDRAGPPDRNDEYMLYQLLVGSWPAEPTDTYGERLKAAMVKSMREAKVRSTWLAPDVEYESAVLAFIDEALDPDRSKSFLSLFLPFQERVARLGVHNSLVQTVIKLTAPGVPDIYQGAELWDLSLVDPDNRRPVDYPKRREILEKRAKKRLDEWHDGAIKLSVIAELLALRNRDPELFSEGEYEALSVEGGKAEQVCVFARHLGTRCLIVASALFPAARDVDPDWQSTRFRLPNKHKNQSWRDVLTGETIDSSDDGLDAQTVFMHLPVAVLTSQA